MKRIFRPGQIFYFAWLTFLSSCFSLSVVEFNTIGPHLFIPTWLFPMPCYFSLKTISLGFVLQLFTIQKKNYYCYFSFLLRAGNSAIQLSNIITVPFALGTLAAFAVTRGENGSFNQFMLRWIKARWRKDPSVATTPTFPFPVERRHWNKTLKLLILMSIKRL